MSCYYPQIDTKHVSCNSGSSKTRSSIQCTTSSPLELLPDLLPRAVNSPLLGIHRLFPPSAGTFSQAHSFRKTINDRAGQQRCNVTRPFSRQLCQLQATMECADRCNAPARLTQSKTGSSLFARYLTAWQGICADFTCSSGRLWPHC